MLSENFINKTVVWFERVIEKIDSEKIDCASDFDWTSSLESELVLLSQEIEAIKADIANIPNFQDVSYSQKSITDDDKWKVFVFHAFKKRISANCNSYPQTTRLIETIPGMTSAMFSILLPNKHIPSHRGPYKGILRLLLPVKMPRNVDQCYIKIKGKPYYWQEGKCFIFDDSIEHEVFNNTNEIRIALFVDFYRPLAFPFNILNRIIYHFILKTKKVTDTQNKIDDIAQALRINVR